MKRALPQGLADGDTVVVVGGGPAGALFAHHLLREGRRLGRHVDVVVVEKRGPTNSGSGDHGVRGCNHCAGGISPRLNEVLAEHGLTLPERIIQERIECVWLHGQWKNFRLPVPAQSLMCSVFRGSQPARRGAGAAGLDEFLLGEAAREGARILHGDARSISYNASGRPCLTVSTPAGEVCLEAGFVTLASGINAGCGFEDRDDALSASVQRLLPAFVPGKSRRALIFELDVGEEYLKRNMHREVHFIEYGSRQFALEHAALMPKGRFLTAVMIGRHVDEADLPRDSQRVMREFLALPQIAQILPGLKAAPVACICCPRLTVTTARAPFGDRFAIIGDAVGSRLYKDGLFSAHVTASALAQTILHAGVDKRALARRYGKAVKWLAADNRYGRVVLRASQAAFARPAISRILYQSFATELKRRDAGHRPLGTVLWKIASGSADYGEVLWEMVRARSLGSLIVGAVVTLRNVVTEALFGLEWGECGRFPTVVLKEERRAVRESLASRLAIEPWESPGFERMYTVMIRGSVEEIAGQLARLGRPEAPFLNLRFVEVRQIQGVPNQVGSVIRYRVPLLRFALQLQLTRRAGLGTYLYEVDEQLVEHGKLILSVVPNRDGNCELSVYASFDYKTGKSVFGRVLWRCARALFPAFVHDVVWNHALCTIKEAIELHPSQDRWASGEQANAGAWPCHATEREALRRESTSFAEEGQT